MSDRGINEIMLGGNLSANPIANKTKDGKSIAGFTLACNRKSRRLDDGSFDQKCDFLPCSAFGYEADKILKLSKGDKVILRGTLQNNNYTDKETGKTVYSYKVYATDVIYTKRKEDKEKSELLTNATPVDKAEIEDNLKNSTADTTAARNPDEDDAVETTDEDKAIEKANPIVDEDDAVLPDEDGVDFNDRLYSNANSGALAP